MKTNVKRLGMEDGRVAYEVKIRKGHLVEDYGEMIRLQENSLGKRRFHICFEGFTDKECENFVKFALINNTFRNAHVRKDYYVNISSAIFAAM